MIEAMIPTYLFANEELELLLTGSFQFYQESIVYCFTSIEFFGSSLRAILIEL